MQAWKPGLLSHVTVSCSCSVQSGAPPGQVGVATLRRPVDARDLARGQVSPALNGPRWLCWRVNRAETCTGCGSRRDDAGGPRSRDMVSVPGPGGGAGDGRWRGPDLPREPPSLRSRGRGGAARTSVPSGARRAGWAGSGDPGVLSRPCARPRVPRSCGDHGEGGQGTVVTRTPGFVRRRCCGLWGPRSLPEGHPFSPECS